MEVVLREKGATNKSKQLVLSGGLKFAATYFIICATQEEKGTIH
jgi:hypothetical protein